MFNKSYDWTLTFLWVCIVATFLFLGYSVFYWPYWMSLTIVAVLLAFFVILAYVKYTKILELKRKFVIVQETFTTVMLIYFAFYYFSGQNEMPADNVLKGARKKIDDIYEASRYHLTMPLVMTAIKTFTEIKNIKNVVKSEVKNFASTDGFSVNNAQIIASEVTNLFQKIKQLIDIVGQGLPAKKDFDGIMNENIDDTISKGKSAKAQIRSKGKAIGNDVKALKKSSSYTTKQSANKTLRSVRKTGK